MADMPGMVTLISVEGRILFQNESSKGYYGDLTNCQGEAVAVPRPHQSRSKGRIAVLLPCSHSIAVLPYCRIAVL